MKCSKCREDKRAILHMVKGGSLACLCKSCEDLYNQLHPSIPLQHFLDADKESKVELGIRLGKLRRKLHPNVNWEEREPIFID